MTAPTVEPGATEKRFEFHISIPLEAAFLFACGADVAIDGAGKRYRAPANLKDEARRCLGELLIQTVANGGNYVLAAELQRSLARAWPGHFTHGLKLPRYSRRQFAKGVRP